MTVILWIAALVHFVIPICLADTAVLFTTSPTTKPDSGTHSPGSRPDLQTLSYAKDWGFSVLSSASAWGTPGEGWVFKQTSNNAAGMYRVCDTKAAAATKNWLKSPFIETRTRGKPISKIEVKIMYAQVSCSDTPGSNPLCSNDLRLKYLETNGPSDSRQSDILTYKTSSKKITAKTFLDSIEDENDNKILFYFDHINVNAESRGLFLAIEDSGSCSVIHSIELRFSVCPETRSNLVVFPETVVGDTDKQVYGLCADASSRDTPPREICRYYGQWEPHGSLSKGCECNPGFQPNASMNACKPCDRGTYKSVRSNDACSSCPANSDTFGFSHNACQCKPGYFRGMNDSVDSPCEKPPPAPRAITYNLDNTVIHLSWKSPLFPTAYQRVHVCYRIHCQRCPEAVVAKFPGCLFDNSYTIYDLDPETSYIIDVYTLNSITMNELDRANAESIQVTTGKLARVKDLTVMRTNHKGFRLAWKCDAINNPQGPLVTGGSQSSPSETLKRGNQSSSPMGAEAAGIVGGAGSSLTPVFNRPVEQDKFPASKKIVFEIKLISKGQPRMLYTTTAMSFVVPNLEEGFWSFQVCVEGVRATCSEQITTEVSSSDLYEFGSLDSRHFAGLVIIILTIIVLIVIILILAIWCIKHNINASRGQKVKWTHPADPHHPSPFNNLGYKSYSTTYAMPATYYTEQMGWGRGLNDYPAQMLEEWEVQQIPLNRIEWLKNDTHSSPNGLPDLCPALLNDHIFNQSCLILVKTAVPNNYPDLGVVAHEVSTCAQFQHPNVVFLYGIALRGPEMLVCLEYTAKGTLESVIAQMCSAGVQNRYIKVAHLLRGIASGMQFFSDLGYVHKVLNAENVYVTEGDVCKIAGFDTRAALEAEEIENKTSVIFDALVPWLSPEVCSGFGNVSARQYSLLSDIWAFGVLMWECISGERPFWNWTQQDIIRSVTSGYNLPAPKDCPQSLNLIMATCVSHDPSQRQFFDKILNNLEKFISNPTKFEEAALNSPFFNLYSSLGECNSAKMMPPDSRSLFTINTSVQEWLQHIKLDHCAPMLLKENRNYLTIGDVLSIDSKTLKSMGISSQDRKVMLKSLDSITVAYHGNFPMENNVASKNNSDILGVTSIAHSII